MASELTLRIMQRIVDKELGPQAKPRQPAQRSTSSGDVHLSRDEENSLKQLINPSKSEMDAYNEFVTAAINCHIENGCNITPKVHLVYKHVRQQMELPGGLGQKREDWVEHQHQILKRAKENYKTIIKKNAALYFNDRCHLSDA